MFVCLRRGRGDHPPTVRATCSGGRDNRLRQVTSGFYDRALRVCRCVGIASGLIFIASNIGSAQNVDPGQIIGGEAPVSPANVTASPEGFLDVRLRPDPVLLRRPVVAERTDNPADALLLSWARRGFAAGLAGVIYDNRDRGHSRIGQREFPQLARTIYAPVFKNRNLDYGRAGPFRFNLPVIGNSSTALTGGLLARSQGRRAIQTENDADRAYALYASNHIYHYPEHRDHDPETGDMFFANTPFFLISQGSSGSDRPFMRASLLAIAALPPATRQLAEDKGLIASTVQMLVRSTMAGIQEEGGYFSGAAHPTAFDGKKIDDVALVSRAHALDADELPPMVKLSVTSDFRSAPGVNYLARNLSERLFTTPAAISRLWRSYDFSREISLSASETLDPNGHELSFHWVLLRGDPDRVRIATRGPGNVEAQISIDWHDRYRVGGDDGLSTNRIDIGVFADNGRQVSAPSFLSVAFPTHQRREYTVAKDGQIRLAKLSYASPSRTDPPDDYRDPAIWPVANWTDEISWSDSGHIAGILRHYPDNKELKIEPGLFGFSKMLPDGIRIPVTHAATIVGKGELRLVEEDLSPTDQ